MKTIYRIICIIIAFIPCDNVFSQMECLMIKEMEFSFTNVSDSLQQDLKKFESSNAKYDICYLVVPPLGNSFLIRLWIDDDDLNVCNRDVFSYELKKISLGYTQDIDSLINTKPIGSYWITCPYLYDSLNDYFMVKKEGKLIFCVLGLKDGYKELDTEHKEKIKKGVEIFKYFRQICKENDFYAPSLE